MTTHLKYLRQVVACIPALLIHFISGVGWGWTAPTILKLKHADSEIKMTDGEISWLVSIGEIGRMSSTLVAPLLMDKLGRKASIVIGSFLYAVVWTMIIFTRNLYILLSARLLFGFVEGMVDVASMIYTAETCSPNFRGTVTAGLVLSLLGGLNLDLYLATHLSYRNVAIANALIAVVGLISSFCLARETTYFLTMKEKHEQAEKNFKWLQVGHSEIEGEMQKIRYNAEEERMKKQSLRLLLTSTTNFKALLTAIGLGFLLSMVGFQAVVPYASVIFQPSEEGVTPNDFTIMYGQVKFFGTAVSLFVVEKFNRRPFIIFSFAVIFVCNLYTGGIIFLYVRNFDILLFPWLLFLSLALAGFFCCLMITAAMTVYSEILPLSVRAIGSSLSTTAGAIGSFITTIIFMPIAKRYGMETNFFIYTVMSLLVIIFLYIILPETRGKTLHEMHGEIESTDAPPLPPRNKKSRRQNTPAVHDNTQAPSIV